MLRVIEGQVHLHLTHRAFFFPPEDRAVIFLKSGGFAVIEQASKVMRLSPLLKKGRIVKVDSRAQFSLDVAGQSIELARRLMEPVKSPLGNSELDRMIG
ncbi:hypothetical protein EPN83_02175 [Patescibacteria group bacterium]|nr:MAG: hypothetical protein EPN83_02175 [Patescibacteria group bacterium]